MTTIYQLLYFLVGCQQVKFLYLLVIQLTNAAYCIRTIRFVKAYFVLVRLRYVDGRPWGVSE